MEKRDVPKNTRKCTVLADNYALCCPKMHASWSIYKICKTPMSVDKTKIVLFRAMGRRQDLQKSWSVDKTKIALFRSMGSDEILVCRILYIFAKVQSLKNLVG